MSKNSLKELPDNFGDLIKLKHLDLYKNELQHLPLSFGKIKALKWLDLKDNPLVPVIREAAGPCLDSKQCQACAKNIVQFYSELQQRVEAEKEMREKQRQRDLQANELALQKQKQQEKKNKKKEKKHKNVENTHRNNNVIDEPVTEDTSYSYLKNSEKQKKKRGFFSALLNIILTLIMHGLFFALFVFLVTSLKFKLTLDLETKVVKQWGQFVQMVPPNYQPYLHDFSYYFLIVHTKTGESIYAVIYYLRYFGKKINADNINYIYEKILNFYYDLFRVK